MAIGEDHSLVITGERDSDFQQVEERDDRACLVLEHSDYGSGSKLGSPKDGCEVDSPNFT